MFNVIISQNYINLDISNVILANIYGVYLKKNIFTQYRTITDLWAASINNLWVVTYQFIKSFRVLLPYLTIQNKRVFMRIVSTTQTNPLLSLSGTYSGISWLEREVWEFSGIYFNNHPDFRRLLTDYGFKWFPLKKTYPVTGYFESKFDLDSKSVTEHRLTVCLV